MLTWVVAALTMLGVITLNTLALQYRLSAMEASSTTVAIVLITTCTCLLAAVQGWIIFSEEITIRKIAGIMCLVAGIALIMSGQAGFKDQAEHGAVGEEGRPLTRGTRLVLGVETETEAEAAAQVEARREPPRRTPPRRRSSRKRARSRSTTRVKSAVRREDTGG